MQLTATLASLALMATAVVAKPTPTKYSRDEPSTCSDPPNQTTGYPDYDGYCQCGPYAANSTAWGNPYLGLAHCDYTCAPANPTQRATHDNTDSLSSCMGACTGSFEKAKRQDDDYWFCHGVNFRQGELCEFIGQKGTLTFAAGSGNTCWYYDSLDS
ncbi:hypothetical protein GGR57DRAFT_384672 [Xylariaceae sp. FL1272]|nr:hypothetical protein GGR57DRAFT_384672 [Xylariaceae sp. FL1272]